MPFPLIFAAVVTTVSVGLAVARKMTRDKDFKPDEIHLDPKDKPKGPKGPKGPKIG